MAECVTCGDELHPERAVKYDYCTLPGCRAENARGLTIVSVGVNKAADQYVLLTDRAKDEMASGKYQDPRRNSFGGYERPRPRSTASPPKRQASPRADSSSGTVSEPWSRSQRDRALALHVTGRKPISEIATRLGLNEHTVAEMLSAAYAQARR